MVPGAIFAPDLFYRLTYLKNLKFIYALPLYFGKCF